MKVALFFLGLVALGSSAPQPRKDFHEHFDDFLAIITNEIGEQLEGLAAQYIENEGFVQATEYLISTDFKNLIYEMEELPEFKAVSIFYFCNYLRRFVAGIPCGCHCGRCGLPRFDFKSGILHAGRLEVAREVFI